MSPLTRTAVVVALILERPLCMACLTSKVGMTTAQIGSILARTKHFVEIIAIDNGRCASCGTSRAVVSVERRSNPAVKYDAPERHGGLRCTKCGKSIRVAGHRVVPRRAQMYHKACAPKAPASPLKS
jgi:hypothetical protein